ncbi:FAM210B [Bugula neritina]|uniref:FAM210B n=1 Tax=Bugula neritina TaxID=10212 RepID=A0A7J7IVT6_BUGNE|nr:FAM210B [Bugula neritina]
MSPSSGGDKSSKKHDRVARLKAAVRDYGSIVIVFHVGIALTSLGFFYTLVASNVDVVSVLQYFNISLGSAQSSVETASTFAVAYAVHKIFAPVRIGITLSCAPLIVRSLRARGILKTPLLGLNMT